MTESVIISAIESLETSKILLKKPDLWEDNFEKLYSLIVGMSDFGEDNKEILHSSGSRILLTIEKLYSFVVGMADSGENKKEKLHSLLFRMADKNISWPEADHWERNKEKVYNLAGLREDSKEKMYRLMAGMADFWEDNKEKLYLLLLRISWKDYKDEIRSSRYTTFPEMMEIWREEEMIMNRADNYDLLVEIADLWGDNDDDEEGEVHKEKLHSLLSEMPVYRKHYDTKRYAKKICRMSGEIAGLWKDKQPKLNKEKLYTWVANKVDLGEGEYLFGVLLDVARHQLQKDSYLHAAIREIVDDLRFILDLITDKKLGDESSLRYFISDAVDMAQHARLLVHLMDSDPFALFLQFLVRRDHKFSHGNALHFLKKFTTIRNGIQEIKGSMLEFRVERSQNIEELKGGENVVGLEEDVKLLLHNEDIGATTIIKGMIGIGKTTLARQVYNHTTIAQQFERRAWIWLSGVLSRKEILISLIRQVVDSTKLASLEKLECADYKRLKQVLRQHLRGVRYFIVLDDVWEKTTHLKYVIKALPKDKGGSRLLLTTRCVGVEVDHREDYYHKMKPLDDDKSWALLLKTLFVEGNDEQFPKPLVKQARHILRKCNGLPLAIKEVGRQWAKKRQSGSQWEEVIESIHLSETLVALESSYHNLDQELKSCFLHLAFFKEDATIKVKKLVQIWMVGGLGSKSQDHQYYLRNLSSESIIEVTDMDDLNYNIKRIRIHAIFHMLAITKAEDELNFEILREDGNNRHSHKPLHRAIYCSRKELINYSSNQDKHLVSLFFHGGGYFSPGPSYWKHFEQLKTLDMEDFGLKILPDVVGTLIELRYLGLRNNYIKELPSSLGRLKKLEVLDITLNFMVEVADIIWEMDSLCHLFMSDVTFHNPLKIDALKNLMTLSYISIDSWTYEVSRLKMMTSLDKLGIEEVDENSDVKMLFASLAELKRLYCLILRGFRFRSMPSLDELGILENLHELKLEGLITRLPSANNFPPNIKILKLINSCLGEDPMPILENLSYLEYLKLQNAYTGQQMVISRNGFSKLNYLVIEELWHLTNVQVGKRALWRLKDLEINSCPYLETLPEDIFPIDEVMKFKMKTTKKTAKKIKELSFISRISEVDIQP